MRFAALLCQLDLFLTLGETRTLFIGDRVVAGGTADTFLIARIEAFSLADGPLAPMTKLVIADLKPVADRYTLVEDETLALPLAVRLGHGFQIFAALWRKVRKCDVKHIVLVDMR